MTPWLEQYGRNLDSLGQFSAQTRWALVDENADLTLLDALASRDQQQFFRHLKKFLTTVEGLQAIYHIGQDRKLHHCSKIALAHPRLFKQLHVLELCRPKLYFNALFGALSSYAIAQALKMSSADIELAFLAGLYHDIGFLCYPLAIELNHPDDTYAHEPSLQAHPAVSAGMIRRFSRTPNTLSDIVKSHHERSDGTGYPNRQHQEIHPISSIVAITDIILRASNEYGYYPCHNHQLTRSVLQLHNAAFPSDICNAAIALTKFKPDITEPPSNPPSADELISQGRAITDCKNALDRALYLVLQHRATPQNNALKQLQGQLHRAFQEAGINQHEYDERLKQLAQQYTLELINLNVLQNEICHQLGRLYTALQDAMSQVTEHEKSLKRQVRDLLEGTELPRLVTPSA
ncbi:MAG TPA: HD domain-containing phosphohydrolase [Marinagarivorans sp.]